MSRKTVIELGENPIVVMADKKEDLLAAINDAKRWMTPALKEEIYPALGRLYIVSAKPNEQSEDFKAKFRFYACELENYPGDIVLNAIEEHRGKYFPALNELLDVITSDRRLRARRQQFDALNTCLENWDKSKRECKPVTLEQMQRMDAFVHGHRAAECSTNAQDDR